ncbi:MAG: FAD-binding protein [Acidobacteria bacterium]|nr:FAD-binding protein [Acidobacteriota bacterium]
MVERLVAIVGPAHVHTDLRTRELYGTDALQRGALPDVVVAPGTAVEIAAIARLCHDTWTPLVPRGGGTGFTGGAVPVHGGVVLSLERLNRILEIDAPNLLAVVEPNVITGDLQQAVEQVGLFYPPDPASLGRSAIGGNVAECAGGPRAFKYGVTRQYVLGLEAVLPTGEIVQTGGKVVKNVVGYDLTQLLVGSEGTLAIVTKVILRLVPKPPVAVTLRVVFESVRAAVDAVMGMIAARVVPATLELIDRESLDAVAAATGARLAPAGAGALLLIEVDGLAEQVAAEADRVAHACVAAGALDLQRAATDDERQELWRVRREISPALKTIAPTKLNNDIVVPKARVPELLEAVDALARRFRLRIPCFGHVGDGNIHVNIMVPAGDPGALGRAREAEGELFRRVVALEGAISGEHGIGFTKAPYLPLALTPETIALMQRVKQAFDPRGILNPGKIFPDDGPPAPDGRVTAG